MNEKAVVYMTETTAEIVAAVAEVVADVVADTHFYCSRRSRRLTQDLEHTIIDMSATSATIKMGVCYNVCYNLLQCPESCEQPPPKF